MRKWSDRQCQNRDPLSHTRLGVTASVKADGVHHMNEPDSHSGEGEHDLEGELREDEVGCTVGCSVVDGGDGDGGDVVGRKNEYFAHYCRHHSAGSTQRWFGDDKPSGTADRRRCP